MFADGVRTYKHRGGTFAGLAKLANAGKPVAVVVIQEECDLYLLYRRQRSRTGENGRRKEDAEKEGAFAGSEAGLLKKRQPANIRNFASQVAIMIFV